MFWIAFSFLNENQNSEVCRHLFFCSKSVKVVENRETNHVENIRGINRTTDNQGINGDIMKVFVICIFGAKMETSNDNQKACMLKWEKRRLYQVQIEWRIIQGKMGGGGGFCPSKFSAICKGGATKNLLCIHFRQFSGIQCSGKRENGASRLFGTFYIAYGNLLVDYTKNRLLKLDRFSLSLFSYKKKQAKTG